MNSAPAATSPCQRCGACCAAFRVSFYCGELSARGLTEDWVEALTPVMVAMRGSNQPVPRCAALQGQIGVDVTCAVYAQRPEPCREVQPGDARCQAARARHGLPTFVA